MTEKNIFGYKLFLSLISHPPPLKVEVLSSPSPFENLVRGSTPPPAESGGGGGGAHYGKPIPGRQLSYETYQTIKLTSLLLHTIEAMGSNYTLLFSRSF